MKKIVAVVLSLVMVLGLATTAFAATTSTGSVATTTVTPVKASVQTLAAAGGSMAKFDDVTAIQLTTVTGKVKADVPYYVPAIYTVTTATKGVHYFVEVAKADADFALVNNGAYTYLVNAGVTAAEAVEAWATPVVMDSIVKPADADVDCGDCYKLADGKVAAYYVSGEKVYYAGGNDFAYFNGEFVSYDATTPVVFDAHNWDADSIIVKATDVKGVKVPVTIACEDCEKVFPIVDALAFENTWVKGVNYDESSSLAAGYYIVLDAATAAVPSAPATDKVESAQTFDAGIAMYVGMSVMAAAGSAVVLKKKD
jgi:hypothetical protein